MFSHEDTEVTKEPSSALANLKKFIFGGDGVDPVRDLLCVAQGFNPGYQRIAHKTFPLGKAYVMTQPCSELHRLLLTEKMPPNHFIPVVETTRYT